MSGVYCTVLVLYVVERIASNERDRTGGGGGRGEGGRGGGGGGGTRKIETKRRADRSIFHASYRPQKITSADSDVERSDPEKIPKVIEETSNYLLIHMCE